MQTPETAGVGVAVLAAFMVLYFVTSRYRKALHTP
jgi:hypothetical protein